MSQEKENNATKTKEIHFRVSSEEREIIRSNAQKCSLSVGQYLRLLGVGYKPKCTTNLQAIDDLLKINADLGRLGGLLKLWLTDDLKVTYYSKNGIRHLFYKIENNRKQLEMVMEQTLNDKL